VAGNTIVLKGHESTPLSAIELARLADEVGCPRACSTSSPATGATVGDALVRSPLSDMITMTGSVRAGREIYAAGAKGMKVLRLELGGKAPFIVLEDADIEARGGRRGRVALHQLRADLHLQRAHVPAPGHRGRVPGQVRRSG
jgi:lactaldehyde dehydrogenase/glycolaldehyde dehydrogenase